MYRYLLFISLLLSTFSALCIEAATEKQPLIIKGVELKANDTMSVGTSLVSSNGKYRLTFQQDGNAVLYTKEGHVLWLTNTYGTNAHYLTLTESGEIIISDDKNLPIWSTQKKGQEAKHLVLQDDGNLAVYTKSNKLLWSRYSSTLEGKKKSEIHVGQRLNIGSSLISDNQLYRLDVQTDGNVTIYHTRKDRIVWSTNTYGLNTTHLILQYDGNLVIYDTNHKGLWVSRTYGSKSQRLKLLNNGKLAILSTDGKQIWISKN